MKIAKKMLSLAVGASVVVLASANVAMAHVVVRPGDAKTGAYQTFTVSVPVEKNSPTISVALDIPEGVVSVTPTVKDGWTIQTTKQGEGDAAKVTKITWTGNKIAVGYRDEFTFSAKTPDQPADLAWKAYQTYQDGTVVSWDQQPDGDEIDGGTTGPFSVTKVKAESDQDAALKNADSKAAGAQASADRALYFGIAAAILSVVALGIAILAARRMSV